VDCKGRAAALTWGLTKKHTWALLTCELKQANELGPRYQHAARLCWEAASEKYPAAITSSWFTTDPLITREHFFGLVSLAERNALAGKIDYTAVEHHREHTLIESASRYTLDRDPWTALEVAVLLGGALA